MRYFAGFLFAVGVLILIVILIVKGFGGHSSDSKTPQITLSDYAHTNTVVQVTIDGPLAADAQHNSLRMTVGQTQNTIQTYRGYQNEELFAKSYPNNPSAYEVFLKALQFAGFTKGNPDPKLKDERGVCSGGDRYIYEIIDASGKQIQRWWSTSCGSQGNFKGSPPQVRNLFKLQIPDYEKITSNLNL